MSVDHDALSPIVAALNDPRSSYIGNPWRNTHYLRLDYEYRLGCDQVSPMLTRLGIKHRISVDDVRGRELMRVWIYDLDAQTTLLELVDGRLEKSRHQAFDGMVRARGKVPEKLVGSIKRKYRDLKEAIKNPAQKSPEGDSVPADCGSTQRRARSSTGWAARDGRPARSNGSSMASYRRPKESGRSAARMKGERRSV